MSMFSQLRRYEPMKLLSLFLGDGDSAVPAEERELWLQEAAVQIARSGPWGVSCLLAFARYADEVRLRALLLGLSTVEKLSSRECASICELARRLLDDQRPTIVAEAVDTLRQLGCAEAERSVAGLLDHPSPYVVGSALRFLARRVPEKAALLLEKALESREPIVRENAVDELDEMNYTPALEKIRRLLEDPDEDVRQAAQTAVAHLEDGAP